ncbi:MAG: PLP-dependent aminotransferase family protein [Rhodobacteraceae bacterium]|nr:PLP-dependent aminotransferase family protein [Paracoccaceae bacterium]
MNKASLSAALLAITLDRAGPASLQSQLVRQLRALAHGGRLRPGDRLPSSRMLAEELSVSRVTVSAAYDQLGAEGYLEGRRGSGVYVAADLPVLPDWASSPGSSAAATSLSLPTPEVPFEPVSDLREFPHREWARLLDQVWRRPEPALLARPDPCGWAPLRVAIAKHLGDWRGIVCEPSQVLITSGLSEAAALAAEAALCTGDRVLVEEPGYAALRKALTAAGLRCDSVPVDAQGFDLAHASTPETARAVAVTPSRQYPLGMTMPLARRARLLQWASAVDGYILEDDFDGEFRYRGQPLPAMMSLDREQRVLYIGSFSKAIFPALRLGFMVFPKRLAAAASRVVGRTGPRASLIAQPVLARFMMEGGFAAHIRRMRRLYAGRQKALMAALREQASGVLSAEAPDGGMHVVAQIAPEILARSNDKALSESAARVGVMAQPLSGFYHGRPEAQGVVLGYAGFSEAEIQAALGKLLTAIRV